jgi:dolichyl-phosphate beta-glucosyltransferase
MVLSIAMLFGPLSWAEDRHYCESLLAQYSDLDRTHGVVAEYLKSTGQKISLVVPAYREERRISASIDRIHEFFKRYPVPIEVLITIENSPDRSLELARQAAEGIEFIKVTDNEVHRGKGYAVKSGILRAQGDFVFYTDLDLATPLAEIFYFMKIFVENPELDIVIGKRIRDADQSALRKLMGKTFHGLVEWMVGLPGEWDTQCGFKGFKCQAAQNLFQRETIDGFSFDIELLMLAQRQNHRIKSQYVHWFNDGDSTVNPILDPIKMFLDLLRVNKIVKQSLEERP